MRKILVSMLASSFLTAAHAQDWFTIVGDLGDPTVDTAQIDAGSITSARPRQDLTFRVSLAHLRGEVTALDAYQSYVSHIAVECATKSVFHTSQVRYRGPQWTGPIQSEVFFQPRPMAFGGFSPELRTRVLSAACSAKNE